MKLTALILLALTVASCTSTKAPTTAASSSAAVTSTNAADIYRQAFTHLPDADHDRLLRTWDDAPLDDSTKAFLKEHAEAISLFRQATATEHCDWGNIVEGRTYTATARLAPSRQLAALVHLNISMLMKEGHADQAYEDMARLLTMTHQIAVNDSLVARFSTDAEFDAILTQVAQTLPDAPQMVVRAFNRAWKSQPAPEAYTAAMRRELPHLKPVLAEVSKEDPEKLLARDGEISMMISFGTMNEPQEERDARIQRTRETWLDPQKRQAAIDSLPELWEETIKVLELPAYKYQAASTALRKKIDAHPLYFFVPPVQQLHDRTQTYTVRRAFLQTALSIAIEGKEAIANTTDPAGEGPLQYVQAGDAYELRSILETNGHQERQRIGHPDPAAQ